LKLSTHLCQL